MSKCTVAQASTSLLLGRKGCRGTLGVFCCRPPVLCICDLALERGSGLSL